jgi:hypothetical protein
MLAAGTEAVLRELGLAQRDQPRREVHPREVAVLLRRVRRPRVGALHRGHAGDVDVVLDERRHAGEVATPRVARLTSCPVEVGVGDGTELVGDRLSAGDGRLDDLLDRHLAGTEVFDDPDRIEVTEGIVEEGVYATHGHAP